MKLWQRITQALAALLLSAAAVSLLFFAGALLLGIAAAALLAAAGLYLAAPEDARKTFKLLIERVDAWIGAMKGIVESAGELLQSFSRSRGAARAEAPEGAPRAPQAPGTSRASAPSGETAPDEAPKAKAEHPERMPDLPPELNHKKPSSGR